jgi:hypothetical protein
MTKALAMLGASSSNTHLFGWFQIVHNPSMMGELIPYFTRPLAALFVLSHQLSKESSSVCGDSMSTVEADLLEHVESSLLCKHRRH